MNKYKITILVSKDIEIEAENRESAEDEAIDRMNEDSKWKLQTISSVCLGEIKD